MWEKCWRALHSLKKNRCSGTLISSSSLRVAPSVRDASFSRLGRIMRPRYLMVSVKNLHPFILRLALALLKFEK